MASVVKKQFLWVSFRSSWLVVKHFVVNCKQSLSSSKIKEACETLMPRTARSAGVGRATPALLAACGIAARILRSQSRSPAYFCFVFPHGLDCSLSVFLSSHVPLFQNESKCEPFHMKVSSACSFIFMQIKFIFIRMVWHLDSPWNRGTRALGNGLLHSL